MVMLSAGKEADKLFEDLANAQAPVPFVTKVSGTLPELYFSRAEIFYNETVYILDTMSQCWEQFKAWLAGPSLKHTVDTK